MQQYEIEVIILFLKNKTTNSFMMSGKETSRQLHNLIH